MKVPQLKKKPETKTCHNVSWVDNYSFVDQKKPSIMEVLKDSSKLIQNLQYIFQIFPQI